MNKTINKMVDHSRVLSNGIGIELQPLEQSKNMTPVTIEEKYAKKLAEEAEKLAMKWGEFFQKLTNEAKKEKRTLEAEQKQVNDAITAVRETQALQKAKPAEQTKENQHRKHRAFLAEQARLLAVRLENMQQLLDAKNWLKLFNYFISKIDFYAGDHFISMFFYLKLNDKDLSLYFFVALLDNSDIRNNSKKRETIIKHFFFVNKSSCSDPKWIEDLFLKLSRIQFHTKGTGYLFDVLDDILKEIDTDKALAALISIYDDLLSNSDLLYQHRHSFLFALDATNYLIKKGSLNVHKIKLANGESFFNALLLKWQKFHDDSILKQPDELVPHHYYLPETDTVNSLYQIKVEYKTETERLTHYVLWCELIPLLSDEELFIQHVKNLFGSDLIKPTDIKAIRDNLIKNDAFILSPELLGILSNAVRHKINRLHLNKNASEFEKALRLLNKTDIYTAKSIFNKQRRQYELQFDTENHNNKREYGGMLFLHENNQYYLLIPANTVIQNQKIQEAHKETQIQERIDLVKMRYIFDGYIRKIFNMTQYNDKEISDYLKFIPDMLCNLKNDLRETLVEHIFDMPISRQHRTRQDNGKSDAADEKTEAAVVGDRHHQEKANVIFKMFSIYCLDLSKAQNFNPIRQQIIIKYKNIFGENPYYQLLANNISPVFYESFETFLVRQFILSQCGNPNLLQLSQNHKPDAAEYDPVCLLNIASAQILNKNLLECLAKIKSIPTDTLAQREIYHILSSLIVKYGDAKSQTDEFSLLLTKITDIFIRANWKKTDFNIFPRIKKILENTKYLSKMALYHEAIKYYYPMLDEDTNQFIDDLRKNDDITALILLIDQLNDRGLTARLTEPSNQTILEKMLDFPVLEEKYPEKNKGSNIISALTHNSHNRVDFNVPLTSGQSWLGRAWEKKQLRNIYQLIQAGANLSSPCENQGKPFLQVFLDNIIKNSGLLQDNIYTDILRVSLAQNVASESKRQDNTTKENNPSILLNWLESLEVEEYSTFIIRINDPDILKKIALLSLQANRLDLFQNTHAQFKKISSQSLWCNTNEKLSQFTTALCQALHVPDESYFSDFLQHSGFDMICKLIDAYHNNKLISLPISALKIGLSTKNTEYCDTNVVNGYLKSLTQLRTSWKESPETESYDVLEMILKLYGDNDNANAKKLSLSDITSIAKSLAALQWPPHHPVESTLNHVFKQEPTKWLGALNGLSDTFQILKISGKDLKEVQKEFENAQPSFNTIVKKPQGKHSLLFNKQQTSIDYFFEVFKKVTTMMQDEKSEEGKLQNIKKAKELYKTSGFGTWDLDQDADFIWSNQNENQKRAALRRTIG